MRRLSFVVWSLVSVVCRCVLFVVRWLLFGLCSQLCFVVGCWFRIVICVCVYCLVAVFSYLIVDHMCTLFVVRCSLVVALVTYSLSVE